MTEAETPRGRAFELAIVLLACLLACWPLLDVDGALGYYDHALHVEELRAMSQGRAIADIACLGIDLGALHTPLYRALGLVVAAGASPETVYLAMMPLSLGALGAASWYIARRRGPGWIALLCALCVVLSPAQLRGSSAILAGMWPFGLAMAALALLTDRLSRRDSPRTDVGAIGGLVGVALLTHLFVVYPLIVMFAIVGLSSLARRDWARLRRLVLAGLLGITIGAAYWVPVAREAAVGVTTYFNPPLSYMLLALVSGMPAGHETAFEMAIAHVPAIALTLLVLAALARSRALATEDDVLLLVLGTTLVIACAALTVAGTQARWLGPMSFRIATLARAGWPAVAALGAAPLSRIAPPRLAWIAMLAGAAAIAAGAPLPEELDRSVLSEARALETHLHSLHPSGRVLLTATFARPEMPWPHYVSHAVGAPTMAAGIATVGEYYAALPPRTRAWTSVEHGRWMGRAIETAADLDAIQPLLDAAAVSDIVLADDTAIALAHADSRLEATGTSGRWSTFRRRDAIAWGTAEGRPVERVERANAVMAVDVDLTSTSSVDLSMAYHPTLALREAVPGARLSMSDDGRVRVDGLGAGHHRIVIDDAPLAAPWWITLVGISISLAMLRVGARKRPAS